MPPKVKAVAKDPKPLKEPAGDTGGDVAPTPNTVKSAKDLKKTVHMVTRTLAGTNETRVAREVEAKEQSCRLNFEANGHLIKKARNPTTGELTPRDEADFVIPMKKTIKQQMEDETFAEFERTRMSTMQQEKEFFDPVTKYVKPRDLQGISSLKERRGNLNNELEQMKKVLEYKKLALAKLALR